MATDFKALIEAVLDDSKIQEQIKKLSGNIKLGADTSKLDSEIKKYNNRQIKLKVDSRGAIQEVNSFGAAMKRAFRIGESAVIAAQTVRFVRLAFQEAKKAIEDYNAAITDLRIVTNENYQAAVNLMDTYNKMAVEMGATTKEVSESAVTWLRQGKTVAETNDLIRQSMILSKIGMIDSDKAAQNLTTTMKGYGFTVEEVATIVDKLGKLDSSAAVTAGDLSNGLSKVAAVAKDAGLSFDTLLGYLSAVGEVSGEVTQTGTFLKTMFSRMSDIKAGKMSLVDEDGTEELLSDVEITLKNVGIDLRKTVTEFDNFETVIDNLAMKWDSLNSVQQAALAKAFSGVRQQNNFRILMANYQNVKKYSDVAANSAGAANEKFNAYLDSVEAKTKTLQATFESLANHNVSGELVSGLLTAATAIVDVIDKGNLLKGTLTGLITVGAIKSFVSLATIIKNTALRFNEFNAALKLSKTAELSATQIDNLSLMTANLSKSQLRAVISSKLLSNEQRIDILRANGLSEAEAKAALATMGLSTAEGTAATTTFTLTGALKGLFQTLLANPLVAVGLAISTAVAIISTARQKAAETEQELLRQAKDNSDSLKESLSDIDDYKTKIDELQESLKNDNLSQEEATDKRKELLAIQDELIKKYGNEKDVIDSITSAIKGETDALDNLSKSAAREYLKKNEKPIVEAQDYFRSNQDYSVSWNESGFLKKIDDTAISVITDFLKSTDLNTVYQTSNTMDWRENEVIAAADQMIIRFKGTRDEIIKGYDTFYDYIEKYLQDHNQELEDTTKEQLKDLLVNISNSRNNILHDENDTYNTNRDTLETATKSALISSYSDIYAEYLSKQEEYQNALAKGDQDIISQAYQDVVSAYQTLVNGITYDVGNVKSDTIKDYLNDIQQEFTQANKEQPLIIDIKAELADSPESFASKIKSDIEKNEYTADDINAIIAKGDLGEDLGKDKALYDNIQGYVTIWNEVAKVTGAAEISTEDYINALTKLGIVKSNVIGADEQSFVLSKDQSKEVTSIFSDVEKLNNAYNKLHEGKLLENDVRELVALFPELAEYTDYSAEKFGNLADGIDKVIQQRPSDFLEMLKSIDRTNLSEGAIKYLDSLIESLKGVHAELKKTDEAAENLQKSLKGISGSVTTLIGFSKEIEENGFLSLSSVNTILTDDNFISLRPYINDMDKLKNAIVGLTNTQKTAYEDLYNEQLRLQNPEAYHQAIEEKEKADKDYLKNSVERIQDEVKNFKNLYDIDTDNWEQISTAKQDILQNTNAELLFKQNKLINTFAEYYNTDLTNFRTTTEAKAALLEGFRKSETLAKASEIATEKGWLHNYQGNVLLDGEEARREISNLLQPMGLTVTDFEHYLTNGYFTVETDKRLTQQLDELLKGYTITTTDWKDMTKNIGKTGGSTTTKPKNDYIDWIERRLKKLAQTTKEVFSSISDYISFTGKNNQLKKAMQAVSAEIQAQQEAYQTYMDSAAAIGLDSTWVSWLQNGGNLVQDVTTFDDELKEKANRYKELYDKAMDCKNAIADLQKTEKEYALQMLSNIDKYYDNRINRAKNNVDYYNSLDTDTQFINKNYGGLTDNYNKQITETQNKIKQLQDTLNSLVSQGLIKEGSDEWYEWIDKIDKSDIEIRELTKSLHELAVEQLNNTKEQYNNQIKAIEYTSKQYDAKIKKLEEQGYMANIQYYAGLKSVQQQNISLLERQAKALQKSLDEALKNGDIQQYSKEWYSAKQAIDDVNSSIDDGKIKLIEYGNAMREIEWGYFDYLQDRISQVTSEADFLIDVMSNSKLFDDNGNITAKGKSSIGLHAQNHNIYLAQAQQYATEIKSINKLLADDPNNKKLIERREELLKLQQQSIQATQKEKKAIVDLVKEGIDLQLKSLKKLIDEYKSSLDNAKNLYEYQKKINDKTSDISKIQKQLMAYQGDNSEESRARIQKLQTDLKTAQEDLQETEYEQFISDTKSLLDNLYEDYEEYMNKRLDNQEQIWREMVGTVNQSTTEISAEIQKSANSIGYTLSKSITDIWSNPNSINKIVVANSTSFNEKLSSINNVLGAINANVSSMVSASGGTFKKYATGGLIDYTGIAQVDGTPTKPELVLNANDTQNFLKFNDEIRRLSDVQRDGNYSQMINNIRVPMPQIADTSGMVENISQQTINNINNPIHIENNFDIPIDHVEDYNDFVAKLQSDKKVEQMIQNMTIGRINGGSSFTKHKYNW